MTARPRRKKKSQAARLRPFWFLLLILVAGCAFAGYYAATWPGFFPQRIAVSGNRIVGRGQILAAAQIAPRANVWLQNMRAAAARIDAIPYVQTAQIHRSLPAQVRIDVVERRPYAELRTRTGNVVIDRDLRVLQTAGNASALPVFESAHAGAPSDGAYVKTAEVQRLRTDYEELSAAHVIVRTLSYDRFGDLVASMRGGVKLLLGDDSQLEQKTALIGPILSQVAGSGRRIAAVDLRALKTPVVVYR
jgi:cell division protein FtsQ